ncbi:hypothetical protein K2P47_03900 [Patescibacteria group bacterium]|nr:hypothetical protein [Patescibacteria group bacterium]
MTLKHQLIILIPLVIIATVLLGYNFMSAQWAGPTATAPNNNTLAPINVGSSTQQKAGTLGVGGLIVFGPAYIRGASTSEVFDNAVTFEVEGRIGADAYCDENGLNCINVLGQQLGTTSPNLGASLLPGWPDMILCDFNVREQRQVGVTWNNQYPIYTTDDYIVFNSVFERQGTSDRSPGIISYGSLQFNIDGSMRNPVAMRGNCHQSMQQLSQQGRTFAFGVSQYGFVSNVRYVPGGHALTKTLQDAGVPGIQNWNVSSIAARNAEMAWVCNYFHPGSVPVDVRIGAYNSPSDNGIHLLNASNQWQWSGAGSYNRRIDGLYCRLP